MTTKLPAGVTKRGTSYRVSVMVNGERRTGTFKDLYLALETLETFRLPELPKQPWTLPEALKSYLQGHLVAGGYAISTQAAYVGRINQMITYFGEGKRCQDFTSWDLAEYAASRTGPLSPNTVKLDISMLFTLLNWSMTMGHNRGPLPRKPKFKAANTKPRYLTEEQEHRIRGYFLDDTDDREMARLTALLIYTGLRVKSEALALTPADIDFENNLITVWVSKSGKPRQVPMTGYVQGILKNACEVLAPTDRIFGDLTYPQVAKRWADMRDKVFPSGSTDVTLHICRHTFCTRLVSGGLDLRTVQTLAGHADIKTTMTYTHFIPNNMESAVRILEKVKP